MIVLHDIALALMEDLGDDGDNRCAHTSWDIFPISPSALLSLLSDSLLLLTFCVIITYF